MKEVASIEQRERGLVVNRFITLLVAKDGRVHTEAMHSWSCGM
jgi:hypothetical protein